MASTQLKRTISSAGNFRTATISCWFKRANISVEGFLFYNIENSNNNCRIRFNTDDKLEIEGLQGGSQAYTLRTTRVFRDTSAWYHLVVRYDSTDGTADNRIRVYVNGTEETVLENRNNPSSSGNMSFNEAGDVYIGGQDGSNYFDGCLAHYHLIDGTSYAPSSFGETDSTSGIWKPKTAPSVTYGTNGFFLKFENSGALGTDSSGNTNTFSVYSGTLTQNVDSPSNNFCTLNRLDRANNNSNNLGDALENANTTFKTTSSNNIVAKSRGTFGVEAGKFYFEGKYGGGTSWAMGICLEDIFADTTAQFWDSSSILAVAINGGSGTLYVNGRSSDSWNTGVSFSSGDIFGFALDVDNKALYIHRNGTYLTANSNVGVPTSGASRTGSVLGELTTGGYQNYIPDGQAVFPFAADISSGNSATMYMNFGQGYFGTTQVASAGTAPSEGGIFEYDCPSGYQALCTKGINSF